MNTNKLYIFVADWCTFCKQVKPDVFELAKKYYKNGNMELFEDSQEGTKELMQNYQTPGYPSFVIVDENRKQLAIHEGPRTYKTILNFYLSSTGTEPVEEDKKYV